MERCMAFETRLTPAMAARWRGAGLWSDETLATTLAERVRATPDREALTDGTYRLSYRELAHGIDRMAARLRALGVGEGDVVTIQLPNWIEFALVFFALERLGAAPGGRAWPLARRGWGRSAGTGAPPASAARGSDRFGGRFRMPDSTS